MSEEIKEFAPIAEDAIKFDPAKKYTWGKEATFTFTGGEFGLLLNALRAVTNTPEAQALYLATEAVSVVEKSLSNAVEAGVVKELEENKASL